jgi:hypothetical protein
VFILSIDQMLAKIDHEQVEPTPLVCIDGCDKAPSWVGKLFCLPTLSKFKHHCRTLPFIWPFQSFNNSVLFIILFSTIRASGFWPKLSLLTRFVFGCRLSVALACCSSWREKGSRNFGMRFLTLAIA